MLSDVARIRAFGSALQEVVRNGDRVVDAGAGLGVLSVMSVNAGAASVVAVEYAPDVATVLAEASQHSDLPISVLNQRSFDVELEVPPDVLVSETIGPVCFEEFIVEITSDLCIRYPEIRCVVPSHISLYAAFARAVEYGPVQRLLHCVHELNEPGYEEFIAPVLADDRPADPTVLNGTLREVEIVGEAIQLHAAELGVTQSSRFAARLDVPEDPSWNVILLWFDATLSPSVSLSNAPGSPITHWRHNYVRREMGSAVDLSFDPAAAELRVEWHA